MKKYINPFLQKVSKHLLPEYQNEFVKWVEDNCLKKTNEVYTYKGTDYIYLYLTELYVNNC